MRASRFARLVPLGVGAGLVAAASLVNLPEAAEPVAAEVQEIAVTPTALPLACPGPLEVPVGAIESGDADLDAGSDDRTFTVSPDGVDMGEGTAVDSAVASQIERVGGGDIAGLAGASCTAASQDQWIVAGSTSLGSSARLVLSNSSEASVRARVTLHGPTGQARRPHIHHARTGLTAVHPPRGCRGRGARAGHPGRVGWRGRERRASGLAPDGLRRGGH
ncbi:DUF5719 family protein [Demequina litorisediminis]|uniref:DUF5719 family protein n=1 Tax=Demequina litorisediminis TaxID=1849022 RepID=UPI0024E06364|nr:DUF5719 family protein [Demequina litorisediminis]